MAPPTAEQVGQRALHIGLLTEWELNDVLASFGRRDISVQDFVQTLVRREILTNYQLERLLKGEKTGFFFDRYKVLYYVGSGSFARVYRVVDPEDHHVRALKVLRTRYSDKPDHYLRFVREGKVGCSLRHPGIVRIDEVVSHGRMHYLVMEFVEGRNLREFVKIRKKLDPIEATRLMLDLTDGLRYAFEHGLTHRDLKMTNVLVSSRGQAKLVDFGLAAMDDAINEDPMGDMPNARSIDYAALERATGVKKDDTRSDIYFLGCIFYNMLTGVAPLSETRDRLQRLSKQRFLDVVPILKFDPTTPHSVALVVNKAMMLDPDRRYQAPSHMLADLEIACRRLTEVSQSALDAPSPDDTQVEGGDSSPSIIADALFGKTVMVVESDMQMQDLFRKGFKKAGFRVLLTSEPSRAFSRLQEINSGIDCLIMNAQVVGQDALDTFNRMAEDENLREVPTVLLLDGGQKEWKSKAAVSRNRVVMMMPVSMRQLKEALLKMMKPAAKEGS